MNFVNKNILDSPSPDARINNFKTKRAPPLSQNLSLDGKASEFTAHGDARLWWAPCVCPQARSPHEEVGEKAESLEKLLVELSLEVCYKLTSRVRWRDSPRIQK